MKAHTNLEAAGEMIAVSATTRTHPLHRDAREYGCDPAATDVLVSRVPTREDMPRRHGHVHRAFAVVGHAAWQTACAMGWMEAAAYGVVVEPPDSMKPRPDRKPGRHRAAR